LVVSGGAFGIDAAAHRGALAADGVTVCVLAGGVDVPYPRAHDALIARMADDGLVVSESPLGEGVRRQRFLTRNRVIAALTRGTIVVEAAERSGTMATAQAATVMNRPLFAVPGPVTSPASAGCHRMIRDGEALLVGSVDEVLGLLDLGRPSASGPSQRQDRDALSATEQRVLDSFPRRRAVGGLDVGRLAGLGVEDTWAALGVLEAGGWVCQAPEGWRLAPRA
jgi:DNA processing protein